MAVQEIEIRAGEQKKIFSRFSSSIPETVVFDVEPVNAGESLQGMVEVRGSSIIIPRKPVAHPLEVHNEIEKGMVDSNFAIWVLPEVDVRVTMEGSASMRLFWLIIIAAMVTVAIAGVIIALTQ